MDSLSSLLGKGVEKAKKTVSKLRTPAPSPLADSPPHPESRRKSGLREALGIVQGSSNSVSEGSLHEEEKTKIKDEKSTIHPIFEFAETCLGAFGKTAGFPSEVIRKFVGFSSIWESPSGPASIVSFVCENIAVLSSALASMIKIQLEHQESRFEIDSRGVFSLFKFIGILLRFIDDIAVLNKFHACSGFVNMENALWCLCLSESDRFESAISIISDLSFLGKVPTANQFFGHRPVPQIFFLQQRDANSVSKSLLDESPLEKNSFISLSRSKIFVSKFDSSLLRNSFPIQSLQRTFLRIQSSHASQAKCILNRLDEIIKENPWNFVVYEECFVLSTFFDALEMTKPTLQEHVLAIFCHIVEFQVSIFKAENIQPYVIIDSFRSLKLVLQTTNIHTLSLILSACERVLLSENAPVLSKMISEMSLLHSIVSCLLRLCDAPQLDPSERDTRAAIDSCLRLLTFYFKTDKNLRAFLLESRLGPVISLLRFPAFFALATAFASAVLRDIFSAVQSESVRSRTSPLFLNLKSLSNEYMGILLTHFQSIKELSEQRRQLHTLVSELVCDFPSARESFSENEGFLIALSSLMNVQGLWNSDNIFYVSVACVVEEFWILIYSVLHESPLCKSEWLKIGGFQRAHEAIRMMGFFEKSFCYEIVCAYLLCVCFDFLPTDWKIVSFIEGSKSVDWELALKPFDSDSRNIVCAEALQLLLNLFSHADPDFQNQVMKVLCSACRSERNIHALSEIDFLNSLLESFSQSQSLVDKESSFHMELKTLIVALGSFHPSITEVYLLITSLLEFRDWQSILQILIEIVKSPLDIPSIQFSFKSEGEAFLESSSTMSKASGISQGYSIAFWIRIDFWGDNASVPLRFFSFSSGVSGITAVEAYIHRGTLSIQTSSTKNRAEFKAFSFPDKKWCHICLVHVHNLLLTSTMNLYVNGSLIESQKLPYTSIFVPESKFSIGTPSKYKLQSNLRWSMASSMLFDCCLNDKQVSGLFNLGSSYVPEHRGLEYINILDPYKAVAKSVSQAMVDDDVKEVPAEIVAALSEHSVICFHASQSYGLGSMTSIFNAGDQRCGSDAILNGEVKIQDPFGLAESLRFVGGLQTVLPIIEKCSSSEDLNMVLNFITSCLQNNPSNVHGMESFKSYQSLAFLLKKKAHLIDLETVRLIFAMTGLYSAGCKGVIINKMAWNDLVYDFTLWGETPMRVQELMLEVVFCAIYSNQEAQTNKAYLAEQKCVLWLLEILVSDATHNKLAAICLRILSELLKYLDLEEESLKLVLDFALASVQLMSHDFENSGGLSSASASPASVTSFKVIAKSKDVSLLKNKILEMMVEVAVWAAQFKDSDNDIVATITSAGRAKRKSNPWKRLLRQMDFEFLLFLLFSTEENDMTNSETVCLVLKLLNIYFSNQDNLLSKFRDQGGFAFLRHALVQYQCEDSIYALLFAILVNKELHEDIPHSIPYRFSDDSSSFLRLLVHDGDQCKAIEALYIIFTLLHSASDPVDFENRTNQAALRSSILSSLGRTIQQSGESALHNFRSLKKRPGAKRISSLSAPQSAAALEVPRTKAISRLSSSHLISPVLVQSVLRVVLELFQTWPSLVDECWNPDFLSELLFLFFSPRYLTLHHGSGSSDPHVENQILFSLLNSMIVHRLRYGNNSSSGTDAFSDLFDSFPRNVEEIVKNSYRRDLAVSLCQILSSLEAEDFLKFSKLAANVGNVCQMLFEQVNSGTVCSDELVVLQALSHIVCLNLDILSSSSLKSTKAQHNLYGDVLESLSNASIKFLTAERYSASLHDVLHFIQCHEMTFFHFSSNSSEFFVCLTSVVLEHIVSKDSFYEVSKDILLQILKNKLPAVEAYFLGVYDGASLDLLESGLIPLKDTEFKEFDFWAKSEADDLSKILTLNFRPILQKQLSDLELRNKQSLNSSRQSSEKFYQYVIDRQYRLNKAAEEAEVRCLQHRQEARERQIFRIFASRQNDFESSKQLEADWNYLFSKLKHMARLYKAKAKANLGRGTNVSQFFLSDRWKLDFIQGPLHSRRKLLRSDLDQGKKQESKRLSISNFMVHTEKVRRGRDSALNPLSEFRKQMGFSLEESALQLQSNDHIADDSLRSESAKRDKGDAKFEAPSDDDKSWLESPSSVAESQEEPVKEALQVDESWLWRDGWLRLLLDKDDDIQDVVNCIRVILLDEFQGILVLCDLTLYVIDGFKTVGESSDEASSVLLDKKGSQSGERFDHVHSNRKRFRYQDIQEIHKRRYLLQPTAIELIFENGQNLFLVLETSKRDQVFSTILSLCPDLKRKMDRGLGLLSRIAPGSMFSSDETSLKKITAQWQNGALSNFEYLLHLNIVSGRSLNDLNQYPVFPWILQDYIAEHIDFDNPSIYRDLSRPIGALTESRVKEFIDRYNSWEDPLVPKFHYGTHYSSAAVVLSYLVRLEPFTQHLLNLQSGKFDRPDRMFHGIFLAWDMATRTQTSDVRELIPEFFYLPEFLQNGNKLDLGERQSGEKLDSVVLPKWAHENAREFIRLHRQALESPSVSARLHEWIDLIWGYKQRGQASIDAVNVFYYLTYEGQVDIKSIDDPLTRDATLDQIRNFGQTPGQLFDKPHPPRMKLPEVGGIFRDSMIWKLLEVAPMSWKRRNILEVPGRGFISWGLPDGSLRIGPSEDMVMVVVKNMHRRIITAAAISSNGNKLLTAGDDSVISVWNLSGVWPSVSASSEKIFGSLRFDLAGQLNGHFGSITDIKLSSTFNFAVSCGTDNNVIVWDVIRLLFSFSLTGFESPVLGIDVSETNGDIVVFTQNELCLWDLNGQFILKFNRFAEPLSCVRLFSTQGEFGTSCSNVIVVGHAKKGTITVWEVKLRKSTGKDADPDAWTWQLCLRDTLAPDSVSSQSSISMLLFSADLNTIRAIDATGNSYLWTLDLDALGEISVRNCAKLLDESEDSIRSASCNSCSKKFASREPRLACRACLCVICESCRLEHLRSSPNHKPLPPR